MTQESSTRNGNYTYNYGYDGGTAGGPGNPTSFQGTANTFNADNQQTNGFTNDGNGNQSNPTNPSAYDPENRLASYYNGAFTAAYDGDGQLAWKQNSTGLRTYFVYDGGDPVLGLSGVGAVVNVFTQGANGVLCQRINGTDGFFTFDPSGNTCQKLSSTQAVVYSHLVTGFGSQLVNDGSTDAYDGMGAQWGYRRESGNLFLLGHRYYSSQRGQFLTRDPIGYGGGVNLYGYTGNDPVNESDPSGLMPPFALAGGGVLGGAAASEGGAAVAVFDWPVAAIAAVGAIGYGIGTGATAIGNHIANGIQGQDGLSAPYHPLPITRPIPRSCPMRSQDERRKIEREIRGRGYDPTPELRRRIHERIREEKIPSNQRRNPDLDWERVKEIIEEETPPGEEE